MIKFRHLIWIMIATTGLMLSVSRSHAQQPDADQPGLLADDSFELDRHPVAGELDHPPAPRAMPGIERQGLGRQRPIIFDIVFVCVAHSLTSGTGRAPFGAPSVTEA